MGRIRPILPLILFSGLAAGACTDRPELFREVGGFRLTMRAGTDLGTLDRRLTMVTNPENSRFFTLDIAALRNDAMDEVDTSFSGWAVITTQPTGRLYEKGFKGTVRVDNYAHAVKFEAGLARDVTVGVYLAHGTVRLLVTDVGYLESGTKSSYQCNNGVDDDGDGFIDGEDRGCYIGGDDSETGGTNATGASPPIYFHDTAIKDVQRPVVGISGDESPLLGERVSVKRGWVMVTRVGTDGLYLTDFEGVTWKEDPKDKAKGTWDFEPEVLSYDSVFAFNFSTPLNLQEGDCLVQLDGTVAEFYGYTELDKPHWKKGDFAFCGGKAYQAGLKICPAAETAGACDQGQKCPTDYMCSSGTCRPDPATPNNKLCRQRMEQLADTPVKLSKLMVTTDGKKQSVWAGTNAERFESALVQVDDLTMFEYAARCDKDDDGITDFDNAAEAACMKECQQIMGCIIFESYSRYGQWTVTFEDGAKVKQRVAVVTSGAILDWDPIKAAVDAKAAGKPKTLDRVVGTMRNLSFGRPPWILETRRPGDCPQCKN